MSKSDIGHQEVLVAFEKNAWLVNSNNYSGNNNNGDRTNYHEKRIRFFGLAYVRLLGGAEKMNQKLRAQ